MPAQEPGRWIGDRRAPTRRGNALVVGRRARPAGQRRIQRHHHGPGAGIGHAIEAAHDAAGTAAAAARASSPGRMGRLGVGVVAVALLATGLTVLVVQQRHADAQQARNQRFVDTATQTVVNMFSYTPDTIDQSVNRFVDGTSGPLRSMLNSNNNVENLKILFRDTKASSEAVINGAALESVDNVTDNASVLVSVRVTVTDIDGSTSPPCLIACGSSCTRTTTAG
ncbi:putative mCE-associated alanine and valine rich protein [Mycobacterium xenopi 4042]|uniref:Putative mCE-associated alanine and valine rich protein n=1 Tax=Mycobacterium xenopi 4042 TaxID=1299334 RepID=X7ZWD5_MYCXE|nr:putative mCE-associated alanine and valine rich protein [Mycobacterium xenopi 4042]